MRAQQRLPIVSPRSGTWLSTVNFSSSNAIFLASE